MIQFSKSSGYAIHALSYLGMEGEDSCLIRDVARHTGIGSATLAKLVTHLTSHGLVVARRGCRGGIALARPPASITLLQVVEAIENKEWMGACPFGLHGCPAHGQCPAHQPWQKLRSAVHSLLASTTLADVIKKTAPSESRVTSAASESAQNSTFYICPETIGPASAHR
jgi:Rrf2 family protein